MNLTPSTTASLRALPTLALLALTTGSAAAQSPVDLSLWNAESYPAVATFGAGVWNVAPGGASVTQTVNGQPTMFVSDFAAFNTEIQGQITTGGSDNDFVGFALGFQPGDSTSTMADYLLIDWKAGNQTFTFGTPSCTPGGQARSGLALARVTGIPTADEFWQHADLDASCSPIGQGVTELARGNTLGNTSWTRNTTYTFRFEFTPTNIKVFVDNVLEIDENGTFANGRVAFYNFSQADTRYSAFTVTCLAGWRNYDAGWPGTQGVPGLISSADPVLGTTIDLVCGNSAGHSAFGCLLIGVAPTSQPSGAGGTWLVQATSILPVHPLPTAGASIPIFIPNLPALCGQNYYAQFFHNDAGASHGFSFSPGLEVTLGL
ncbi:MAG: hypothetical protein NXI31_12115 [bacterium]|nr:hypothetical protein [bacterium]